MEEQEIQLLATRLSPIARASVATSRRQEACMEEGNRAGLGMALHISPTVTLEPSDESTSEHRYQHTGTEVADQADLGLVLHTPRTATL